MAFEEVSMRSTCPAGSEPRQKSDHAASALGERDDIGRFETVWVKQLAPTSPSVDKSMSTLWRPTLCSLWDV